MKKIYTHENRLLVFHARNLLERAGIPGYIKNEFSGGGVGDLSPFETWPELWVDDEWEDSGRGLIEAALDDSEDHAEWLCQNCGESNEGNFLLCWNCNQPGPSDI